MKLHTLLTTLPILTLATAHGAHDGSANTNLKEKPPTGLSWEEWHMKAEHGLDEYDPESFFKLHDSRDKKHLDRDDILNTYGLHRDEVVGKGDGLGAHDDSERISAETKDEIVKKILELIDKDGNGLVEQEEYLSWAKEGGKFPDLGVGVGHHGDFEHEYEVHHWNKYHKDQDPDMKVVHKEDIEHELLHHEHEIEHEQEHKSVKKLSDQEFEDMIVLRNIPPKYRS